MLASRRRRRILFSAAAAEKMFGLAELAGYPPKFLLSQPIIEKKFGLGVYMQDTEHLIRNLVPV